MPDNTRLWTRADVAEYLGVSVGALKHFVHEYTFPRPIKLPNGRGGESHPKWKPADIIAWVDRYREEPAFPEMIGRQA